MSNIDFAGYNDDNAPYDIGENSSNELMQWFSNNQMKANADKCHLLTNCNEESNVCIDHRIIKNSKCEKLLAVKFHQQLNFNPHSNNICKKSRTKTKCIVYNYTINRYPKELNAIFMSQFTFSVDVP